MLPLPCPCMTHFVLHAQDHAENICVERRGIAFRGLVRDRTNLAFGAGIVHRDIETAKSRDGLVDQSADVGVDELGLRTERAQLLDECLAGLITPTGNDHLRALLGEGDGGGAADAGEATGDQDYWVAHISDPCNLLRPYRQSMQIDLRQRFRDRRLFLCMLPSRPYLGTPGALEKDFVGWGACLAGMEGRHGATASSLFRRGRGGGKPDSRGRKEAAHGAALAEPSNPRSRI
jgi:hypothetical protein